MATIKLYGFLAAEHGSRTMSVEIEGKTVRELLKEIEQKVDVVLFENGKVIPTLLILVNGKEYRSLGLLEEELDGAEEVKIVPTFHGGGQSISPPRFET